MPDISFLNIKKQYTFFLYCDKMDIGDLIGKQNRT